MSKLEPHTILASAVLMRAILGPAFFLFFQGCGDPVEGFDGFVKGQLEFLLGGSEGKSWELAMRSVDGQPVDPSECTPGSAWIFLFDQTNDLNPLLYGYDPLLCDSLAFCNEFAGFCRYDSAYCAENPGICEGLPSNILNVGTWFVQEPEIVNTPTDTVYLNLWDNTRVLQVEQITATRLRVSYQDSSGSIVEEEYTWQQSDQNEE